MKSDKIEMLLQSAELVRCFFCHIMMGSSVEAIATAMMQPVEFVGQGIPERFGRHALMEGRIENRHLGDLGTERA